MIPGSKLKSFTREAAAIVARDKDVAQFEIYCASGDNRIARLNYTSDIPCRGVEELKSHSADGFDAHAPGRRFDAVLVDIDHSPTKLLHPRHGALYTPTGLKSLADHLHPGGVFALWSNDPPDQEFQGMLADAFATATAHVVPFDNAYGDPDARNTVYVAVKPDLPIREAIAGAI